uniref:Uncharacterized protein n=1 Tax=Tanacetum cinerariifolium TaxID=118510 RepID=A0A699HC14_TANCI|nr:hypothetical protein [Tanacetum cinerariifolium]GEX79383.1 hypothetical protein [Tanacetum cinerariifolium]
MVVRTQPTLSLGHSSKLTEAMKLSPFLFCKRVARRRALERAGDIVPSTYEVGQSSKSTPDQQLETSIQTYASLDHTITSWDTSITRVVPRVPTVSPIIPSSVATQAPAAALDEDALLEIEAQLELYGSREEIHSQHFRLKSLERVKDETMITIGTLWQPILALEHATNQCEMQELKDRIAALEQMMDS